MQNKIAKFLLSLLIASFSTLCFPLNEGNINNTTKIVTVQEVEVVEIEPIYNIQSSQITIEEVVDEYDIAVEEMNKRMEDINTIPENKEWFIAYKSLIEEYNDIIDPPETIYDWFTSEELDLLFKVVQAEIGDEYSFEQKTNVASVIFNRFWHDQFPNTLSEILIASQFSVISNGRYKDVKVSEDTILSCEYAFTIGDTTDGCLFFDSNSKLKYKFIYNDGAHNFYKLNEEK